MKPDMADTRAAIDTRLQMRQRIPMRDGIDLSASIYLPSRMGGAVPAIVTMTPYTAQTSHQEGTYFASKGYAVVVVDVRGRGNSEGTFSPNVGEGLDGHDIIEWVGRQSFCNGKVGMWGGSYSGFCQWVTAAQLPSNLETIIPVASPWIGIDFPIRGNIAMSYIGQYLAFVDGRTVQNQLFWDQEGYWNARFCEWFESGRPFSDLLQIIGVEDATFRRWLEHDRLDSFWTGYNPSPAEYDKIDLPILSITGQCDGDLPGTLAHYQAHQSARQGMSSAPHHLLIGPWDHAGTRYPQAQFSGISAGAASLLDLRKLNLEWYDWVMRGGSRPSFLDQRIQYYVFGADEWRGANSLDAVLCTSTDYRLGAPSNPCDVFHSGYLEPVDDDRSSLPFSHYRYDPRDVSHAEWELSVDPNSRAEQRMHHVKHGKQLYFHTAPFKHDVEMRGHAALTAYISIDQPDTDFHFSLHEIDIDGAATLICSDVFRARFRDSLSTPVMTEPLQTYRYEMRSLFFTARKVAKGHRLRLVFGPVNSIFWEKNHNSGKRVSSETINDARTVEVRLHHGRDCCSVLHLPILPAASAA